MLIREREKANKKEEISIACCCVTLTATFAWKALCSQGYTYAYLNVLRVAHYSEL